MRIILQFVLAVICLSLMASAGAQENIGHAWSRVLNNQFPQGGNVIGRAIKTDASGNTYIIGEFRASADFDPGAGTVNLTSAGGSDIFFAKYDASGNYVYAKRLGGTAEDVGFGIAVDGSGNVYVTGYFIGTGDFDPGAGTANLISSGIQDIFFAKYDASGNYVYAKALGGTSSDFGYGIAVDGSGNVCVTGVFQGTVDFDPGAGTVSLTSAGSYDVLFAKYDADGNYVYAKALGGTGSDFGNGIAVDGSGNVYVTGYFSGTADFDPGAGTANIISAGTQDIFFAKYDASGNYVYAKALGGTGGDYSNDIALDGSGNVYVTGYFNGTGDFDPGAGTANLTSAGNNDLFFAKYDASGNYVYAKAVGGTGYDIGYRIVVDGGGNVYVTGYFDGTVDFDPGAGTATWTSAGASSDIFFAKYDASGNYVYARGLGGTSTDIGNGIAVDGSGNVYVVGEFQGTVDFDPGPGTANLVAGISTINAFAASYNTSGNYRYAGLQGNYSSVTLSDIGRSVAVDGSGNVYVVGEFQGTVDFDPGPGTTNLISAGNQDIFFAKYDATGNLVYARAIGGTSTDIGYGIAVDGSGNVYVTGVFIGTVDFDPGAGTVSLNSAGNYDIFFSKYDASGNYVYARRLGGTLSDFGYSIAVDGSGNVYVTGVFRGTVDFDPGAGTVSLTSAGNSDIFFAKYDASGNYLYARRLGGTNIDAASAIVVDGSGNVYVTGNFNGTVDFDPGAGTVNLTSAGSDDIFFAKYNASGNYVYARAIGGTSTDVGNGIKVDGSGNVYVTGYFNGTVDFDPGAGTVNLISAGNQDIFFAKYDASGNYVYAKTLGGTSSDFGYGIAVDGSSNVYVTGVFFGTGDFDPGAGTANLISSGNQDIFFAKYDASGNYVYAKALGGTSTDFSLAMALDGSGNLYVTGYFSGTADFDPSTGVASLAANNPEDIFFTKYTGCSTPQVATVNRTASPAAISGTTTFTDGGCSLVAVVQPNGASPVSGTVNAQVWIESSVPTVATQPFVARHYEITPATNPSTATGRVTLYFTQQEFTDFNNDPGSILDLPTGPADAAGKANLRIEKRNGTSSNGTGLPNTYSGSITTIDPADADIVWNAALSRWEVSFDVTGFSGFFVKTTPSVLPLTLLEFNGRLQNGDALLNWKTENEVNTDKFLVERSTDGRNFSSIGTVAARNQPGANLYNYTDAGVNTLAASMVYYRLKQTDIDSRFTYSRIITLPLGKQNQLLLYPNPASDQLMITVSAERAEKVQVRIIDNAGRILRQQHWNIAAGSATIQLEVSTLAKGLYYLEVKGETTDQRKTFVKQ